MPYLDVTLADSDFQRTCSLTGDQPIVIGRAPDCDLHIAHRSLSREHCALTPSDGGWLLEDRDSTNGTQLNGKQLVGSRPLQEGDCFKAGVLRATYHEHELTDNTYATTYPALEVPSAIARRSEAVEHNMVRSITETHTPDMVDNDELTIDTDEAFIDLDDEPGSALWDDESGAEPGTDSLWLD